jgi:hypothetical protein
MFWQQCTQITARQEKKKEKINIFRSCKRRHLTLLMTIDGEEANKEFEGG